MDNLTPDVFHAHHPSSRAVAVGAGRAVCRANKRRLREIQSTVCPASARTTMPADWSEPFGTGFLGRVRYIRTFQKPTGLERGDKVWLVVEPPRSLGVVRLSGHELGTVRHGEANGRFDITAVLTDRNALEIVVEIGPRRIQPTRGGESSLQSAGA